MTLQKKLNSMIILIGITVSLMFINHSTNSAGIKAQSLTDDSNQHTLENASIYDDDFNLAQLDPKWSWIREVPTHWSLSNSPGNLQIITQPKDIWESSNTAPLLLQLLESSIQNYDIRTRVVMTPLENYQQGGLVVYQDDDNYVRFTYAYINGSTFEFAKELNGDFQPFQVQAPENIYDFYLRLVKIGKEYRGYYSTNEVDWTLIGIHQNADITPLQVGLIAFNAEGMTMLEIPANFDFFKLDPISPLLDCSELKVFYGITHCKDINDDAQLIVVDLNDSHVSVRTVLSSRNDIECNSVNHNGPGKDPTSNCDPLYPVETVEDMLTRYREQELYRNVRLGKEAVAIINTDYFALDWDHGAQGLAVQDGIRLDGEAHNDNDAGGYLGSTKPSLAISNSKSAMIGVPKTEQETIEEAEQNINLLADTVYSNTVGGAPIIISDTIDIGNSACSPTEYPFLTCHNEQQSAAGLTNDEQLVLITARKDATGVAEYLIRDYPLIFQGSQVHTALKFDGSHSASMAWVDKNGEVIPYFTGNKREVAEGLLIFSSRICPVEDTLNQNGSINSQFYTSNVSDLISQYRQFRDDVLRASVVGQKYLDDYYIYGPEVSLIILTDADLRNRTAQFLENAAPALGSLLPNSNEDVVLTQTLYDEAEYLAQDLASAGSKELSNVIIQTWEDLALDKHIGENATDIWQQMQKFTIFLPIINE